MKTYTVYYDSFNACDAIDRAIVKANSPEQAALKAARIEGKFSFYSLSDALADFEYSSQSGDTYCINENDAPRGFFMIAEGKHALDDYNNALKKIMLYDLMQIDMLKNRFAQLTTGLQEAFIVDAGSKIFSFKS